MADNSSSLIAFTCFFLKQILVYLLASTQITVNLKVFKIRDCVLIVAYSLGHIWLLETSF